MNRENVTLLNEEIKCEFEELKKLPIGSDDYKTTVDGLTKLMDRSIEIKKLDEDSSIKSTEVDIKCEQFEDEKKDRKIRNILTAVGIIIPTGVTIWGTMKSLKFEETGTVTTMMGRGFINKLLPKK